MKLNNCYLNSVVEVKFQIVLAPFLDQKNAKVAPPPGIFLPRVAVQGHGEFFIFVSFIACAGAVVFCDVVLTVVSADTFTYG